LNDRVARAFRLLLLLVLAALSLAPAGADAYIYFPYLSEGNIPTADGNSEPGSPRYGILRADLGGRNGDAKFIRNVGQGATGLAAGPAGLYWSQGEFLARADLDGRNPNREFLQVGHPSGIAADPGRVYWINDNLGRAKLDGTDVEQTFLSGGRSVAVDGSYIYSVGGDDSSWGTAIRRANIDGTDATPGNDIPSRSDDLIQLGTRVGGIAVSANHIYWTSPDTNSIGRANIDGSDVKNDFITDVVTPRAVAVDLAHVYWIDAGGDAGRVGRAKLDGTAVKRDLIDLFSFPEKVNFDARGPDGTEIVDVGGVSFEGGLAVDALGPPGSASAKKNQENQTLRSRTVRVLLTVTADTALTAKLSGSIRTSGLSDKLKPQTLTMAAGDTTTVELRPTTRSKERRFLSAFKKRFFASANVKVKLVGAGGSAKSKYKVNVLRRGFAPT
jgi:hypothetical protein